MADFDLVIRGGTVVTASDSIRCDVAVKDGRIVALGEDLGSSAKTIDASGLLVMPGGIDSHVHFDQPQPPGIAMADGFETGTRAAVAGGTTTVIPFAMQIKGERLRPAVEAYHRKAAGNAYCDYGFHLIVSDPSPEVMGQELPALLNDGLSSYKVFMTYEDLKLNDRELLEVFEAGRRDGALVMVHCEGYDAIRHMTLKLEAAGKTAPYYHAESRPALVEREAAHRAISHAELIDVPIMIVHVSSREALEQIRWARARGRRVYAETCPQYITLTASDLEGLNMDMTGSKYVCSPPPRDADSQKAIWEGLIDGSFDVFSSDHCPFRYEDVQGKLNPKGRTSFRWVPNGIPGIETRSVILFSEGVSKGRISAERFVQLNSTNHARLYGLYPRKGTIGAGADADIVLWDPNRRETITQKNHHHGSDYTPWEGMAVTGWPVMTIVGGEVACEDGRILGAKGRGRFLHRALSPYARPEGTRL